MGGATCRSQGSTYSNDNPLTGISYGGTGTAIGSLSYTWDANKNKASEGITGVMSGYGFTTAGTTYDHLDRLIGFARASGSFTQSWNLTSVGDWNSVTTNGAAQNRTHGPTHELLTAGGQSVTTDVKGNITLLPAVLSGLTSTASSLLWDFDNKLKSADVDNNGTADVNFHYDALGRRVARVGSSGSLVFVQLDQQTIADYGYGDNPSSPLYRYAYASYIDEPVVRKGAGTGGTIHYYHRNQQYSINAVTTSTGSVAERFAYTAYGQPTILGGSGVTLPISNFAIRHTYTGREWDATLGLYHFRARWMSGLSGRFLTRDPIGFGGGKTLYQYVNGSPINYVDSLGLKCVGPTLVTSPKSTWKVHEAKRKEISRIVWIGFAKLLPNDNSIKAWATDTTLEVDVSVSIKYAGWTTGYLKTSAHRECSISCVEVKTDSGKRCFALANCNEKPDTKEKHDSLLWPFYEMGVAAVAQVQASDPAEVVTVSWAGSWAVGCGERFGITLVKDWVEITFGNGRVTSLFDDEDEGGYSWKCDCE